MHLLRKRGARLEFHDPLVDIVTLDGSTYRRVDLTNNSVARADLVAVLTAHRAYDLDWVSDHARFVFDARNAFGPSHRTNLARL
jgi:UDP-N-acetyl-D-glucosamine dehydrogenase